MGRWSSREGYGGERYVAVLRVFVSKCMHLGFWAVFPVVLFASISSIEVRWLHIIIPDTACQVLRQDEAEIASDNNCD